MIPLVASARADRAAAPLWASAYSDPQRALIGQTLHFFVNTQELFQGYADDRVRQAIDAWWA